jgi:hydrogenase small subunit
MNVTRRDFLKASAAIASALALKASGLMQLQRAMAGGGSKPPVIWLQGQGCTGCSVSLLNSTYFMGLDQDENPINMTIDKLLIDTIDLRFHPTVMAAAGDKAVEAANEPNSGYVLVIEGAIPRGADGEYCHIWEGTTMLDALELFARDAGVILAVGTCASYGGLSAGSPNPTGAMGVDAALRSAGISKSVINIPGCPSHPDWIIGTVAELLAGRIPELDDEGRPTEFFGTEVHKMCPNRGLGGGQAEVLSDPGCLSGLGCKGQKTHADCPVRKWNAALGVTNVGVNWCIGARNPCQGCTEPDFPDGMSPFYHPMEKNINPLKQDKRTFRS